MTYVPGTIIPAAITLITSSIFTRHFSASEYGVFSLFLIIANTFRSVASFWLQQVVGRYIPGETDAAKVREIKNVIFMGIWLIFILESTFGMVAVLVIKRYLALEMGAFLFPMLIYVISTSIFDLFTAILPAEMQAKSFVFYKLADSLVTFVLRLVLVFLIVHMDIKVMFWSVTISSSILIPFLWKKARFPKITSIVDAVKKRSNWVLFNEFVRFGLPMTFWYFTSILHDVSDRYILQFYLGVKDVGIYDANYRLIVGSVFLVVIPVTLTLAPYLMKIAGTNDVKKTGEVLGLIIGNMISLGFLAVGMMFLFHADIALIFLGPEFREGSIILPYVFAGVILNSIGTFAHKPYEIIKKTKVMLLWIVLATLSNIGLNFILIPYTSYRGAAYATMISYFIYTFCIGMLGKRHIPWNINWRDMVPSTAIFSAGITLVIFLRKLIESNYSYIWGLVFAIIFASIFGSYLLLHILRVSSSAIKQGNG